MWKGRTSLARPRGASVLLTCAEDGRASCLAIFDWLLRNQFDARLITRDAAPSGRDLMDYADQCFREVRIKRWSVDVFCPRLADSNCILEITFF